jgi:beta-lactamase regulating signal transducer with metallopeptidase domain
MEPVFHAISVISAAVVSGSFSAIWEGAVLVACAALCLRMLPGLSAAARSAVWMLLFALLVALEVLPSFTKDHTAAVGPVHGPPLHVDPRWSLAIVGVWAALSLWKGTQLVLTAVRLYRMAGRAEVVQADGATQALLDSSNGGRAAQLCTSPEVERPSVFGFLRPRILLPHGLMERLTPAELQQVVMHEMEHLRRADDWTNLLQKIGLVLFPLNPVLFWVERRLCAERELACDDRVLHSQCGRKAYAVCLTRLAEYSMLRRGYSLVLGALDKRPELVRRVHRILWRPQEGMSRRRGAMVTAGLVVGLMAGAAGLARSPQLVSFAPVHIAQHKSAPLAEPVSLQASVPVAPVIPVARVEAPREIRTRAVMGSPKAAKVVMARADMDGVGVAGAGVEPVRRVKQPRAVAVKQQVKRRHDRAPQDWVVLTEWRGGVPGSQMVIAVARTPNQQTSYAAVQIADGWLIVQI